MELPQRLTLPGAAEVDEFGCVFSGRFDPRTAEPVLAIGRPAASLLGGDRSPTTTEPVRVHLSRAAVPCPYGPRPVNSGHSWADRIMA